MLITFSCLDRPLHSCWGARWTLANQSHANEGVPPKGIIGGEQEFTIPMLRSTGVEKQRAIFQASSRADVSIPQADHRTRPGSRGNPTDRSSTRKQIDSLTHSIEMSTNPIKHLFSYGLNSQDVWVMKIHHTYNPRLEEFPPGGVHNTGTHKGAWGIHQHTTPLPTTILTTYHNVSRSQRSSPAAIP